VTKILVLNGPNLNLLGEREPELYGSARLSDIEAAMSALGSELGVEIVSEQSNHEGELIDRLQAARSEFDAIVFNPGAFTHYSYALRDTVSAISVPVIECHLTNVDGREEFRRTSVIAPACAGRISGFGVTSYMLAIRAAAKLAKERG
jgi:3-dehydroquinate dehydratase-2